MLPIFKFEVNGQADFLKAGAKTFQSNQLGIGVMDGGPFGRADFVREPGGRLFSQTSSGRRHQYLYDGSDAIVGILSDTGTLGGYIKYGPYGEWKSTTGQDAQIYHYYRQSIDAFGDTRVTGLYKFGERFYNATDGRWTQLDPLDQPDNLRQANRYAYVGDDPVNLSDPSGLKWYDDLALFATGVSTGLACGSAVVAPNPLSIGGCAAGLAGTTAQVAARSDN